MGALLSSLRSRCISLWSRWSQCSPPLPPAEASCSSHHERLPDIEEEGESKVPYPSPPPKKRALLIGITYHDSTSPLWTPLDGPHVDVKHFQQLLIHTYGYSPEDIVVLKDDPTLPEHLHPTRANMIRELKQLVSGAAPGDKFTFLYSGHSDQQLSFDDIEEEEDGQDEVIITCDLRRIIDNELKYILVKDLPVGCSLLAILDTCHSGTMLDLPHYHCNNIYVPWLSKGNRRTKTMQNKIVRGHAFGLVSLPGSGSQQSSSIASMMDSQHRLSDTRPGTPLRVTTDVGGALSANQRELSVEADARGNMSVLSPTRTFMSPISRVRCDGWCGYDLIPRATVVSLSACADLQRAWEGPRGSLTVVLCEFLKKQPSPSYGTLMSHVNFQLHANCRALHNYTLQEKKKAARGEGPGFDGELNNFQAPQLSSLAKLNMNDTLRL
ncbi:Caspase domain containing protein [Russula decolorans]